MLIVKNKKATLDQRTKREGNNHLLKKGESGKRKKRILSQSNETDNIIKLERPS